MKNSIEDTFALDDFSSFSGSFSDTNLQAAADRPQDFINEHFAKMAWNNVSVHDPDDTRCDVCDVLKCPLTQGIDGKCQIQNILKRQLDNSVLVWETKCNTV